LLAKCEVVGANGALALRRDGENFERRFDREAITSLLQELDALQCAYLAYGADFVIPSAHPHAMHRVIKSDIGTVLRLGGASDIPALVKVLVLPTSGKEAAIAYARKDPAFTIAAHSDGTFDVMPDGTDKTSGLLALGYPLPLDAAMGNDTNDVALLRNARLAVAVGNNDNLCPIADFVVPPGHGLERRVAEALQHILQSVTGAEKALQA
jgi:hydroxymethylpyrimidine pyrophosphatase-like HAD family hydrolase